MPEVSPTLPSKGDPLGNSDAKIREALIDFREAINGEIGDDNLVSPNNSVYRTLLTSQQTLRNDVAAGTYIVARADSQALASGADVMLSTTRHPPFFYFDDADYTVAGKTQKLRLRAQILCNATKAAIKLTFGLYPITVAGGADALTLTLGTVISGSTVEINEPAASTVSSAAGSDFAVPSDGAYALGVVTSGTLTNNSAILLSAQLQTRSV